jgi:FkbM family methyltransferase
VTTPALELARALGRYARLAVPLVQATRHETVAVAGLRLRIPGPFAVRASVLAGTTRVRAVMDAVLRPGAVVVDVGANVGYVTALAAARVGPGGRVVAIEPAADNVAVLRENLAANGLANVEIVAAAAGPYSGERDLFLRGAVSAVNSLYPDSCYAAVTRVVPVPLVRVDDVVDGPADLVKIDVEGGEIEVLAGMPRLLDDPSLHLVVEWHPALQQAAGHGPCDLPAALFDRGFVVEHIGDFGAKRLARGDVAPLAKRLLARRRPIELYARRA